MKVAVVTGGAHGIGKAIALALLEQGCAVVVLDMNDQYIDTLKRETAGRMLRALVCDVGNAGEIKETMNLIGKMHGKIDYMVNNAGIGWFIPIDEMTVEDWNRILSVNLSSIFYMVKFGKHLLTEGSAIVNIASTRALMSTNHSGAKCRARYAASQKKAFRLSKPIPVPCKLTSGRKVYESFTIEPSNDKSVI